MCNVTRPDCTAESFSVALALRILCHSANALLRHCFVTVTASMSVYKPANMYRVDLFSNNYYFIFIQIQSILVTTKKQQKTNKQTKTQNTRLTLFDIPTWKRNQTVVHCVAYFPKSLSPALVA